LLHEVLSNLVSLTGLTYLCQSIDKTGRIAYVGGEDPFGFKPSELREAMAKLLEV